MNELRNSRAPDHQKQQRSKLNLFTKKNCVVICTLVLFEILVDFIYVIVVVILNNNNNNNNYTVTGNGSNFTSAALTTGITFEDNQNILKAYFAERLCLSIVSVFFLVAILSLASFKMMYARDVRMRRFIKMAFDRRRQIPVNNNLYSEFSISRPSTLYCYFFFLWLTSLLLHLKISDIVGKDVIARDALLTWTNKHLEILRMSVNDFSVSWKDGKAFLGILYRHM